MKTINKLAAVAFGIHFADQLALVLVPLVAAIVFDASAEMIGVLVACQTLAHLLGSLPFGILVDRARLRTLALASALISLVGFCGVSASIYLQSLLGFGITVTFAGFGVVLFTLSALSIVPLAVKTKNLARANATIEMPRALVSFGAPLTVGILITQFSVGWFFMAAAFGAAVSLIIAMQLPEFKRTTPTGESVLRRLRDGGGFVIKNGYLRAISLCAIFWNLAFTGLLVVMVPLLAHHIQLDPGVFGIALAAFGLAAIAGNWTARQIGGNFPPNILLVFGPATSLAAVLILYAIPEGGSVFVVCVAFFLMGFGPAIWLVTQNSVRQLVTPANMLGRVNAVIQTAIYGVRPLGALLGGAVVGATSPQTGLVVVILAFFLSFLTAAFSQLRFIKRYSELETPARQLS